MANIRNKNKKPLSADVALGLISEDEDDYSQNSDSENNTFQSANAGQDSDDIDSDEDQDSRAPASKRSHFDAFDEESDGEENDEEEEEEEELKDKAKLLGADTFENEAFKDLQQESKLTSKLKTHKLTPEQLAKHQKKVNKTGVIYLSKIPPYMKPAKMRQILSRFGDIDRLFLKPEDIKTYKRRVKYGGNKKRSYIEGWAEFLNKKDAKLCAHTLNGNNLGGKKGSFYYDDVMNIKYIKGFKWTDLTEQITRENEIRQSKLQAELSQTKKLNKAFIANVEKSKMIANMQKNKKAKNSDDTTADLEIRRTFAQRSINSKRADAPEHMKIKENNNQKLNNVLSNIF